MADESWLDLAIELAVANVAEGGGPFGALVVEGGVVLGKGGNRVTRDLDPTAHAEVVAIRAACRVRGDFSLEGATLYASCEPCPLCLAAALWGRLDRVVFAATRDDAARAGFDDAAFYELIAGGTGPGGGTGEQGLRLERLPRTTSEQPFDAWRADTDHVAY